MGRMRPFWGGQVDVVHRALKKQGRYQTVIIALTRYYIIKWLNRGCETFQGGVDNVHPSTPNGGRQ